MFESFQVFMESVHVSIVNKLGFKCLVAKTTAVFNHKTMNTLHVLSQVFRSAIDISTNFTVR